MATAYNLLYKSVKNHDKSKLSSEVNSFWVIQNNKPVIDNLNTISNWKAAKSVSAFDFWTL